MSYVELLPADQARPDNPAWHELRRTGISASEIAAVLGISPWESPFSLYWRKVNGWRTEATENMRTGTRLEPVIADWWADEHDPHENLAVHRAGLYVSSERPWQLATPDRLLCDPQMHDNPFPDDPNYRYSHADARTWAVLECKWTGSWDHWGEPGTDDIPVYYRAQVLWQCDVLEVDEWQVAVLGPGGFRAYGGRRDDRDLAVMREHARRFIDRLDGHSPPNVDDHTATVTALKKLHPSVEDRDVEVPLELAEGYRRARALRARAQAAVDGYEARARALLGDGRRLMCGGRLVVSRSVYDRKPYEVGPTTIDKLNPGRAESYAD